MAAVSFLSLPDSDLQRKMKEVEKPRRDVGKEKRGKIWIHLTKKKIYVYHFHQQSGIHSKLQNQFCQYGNLVGQFSY